MRAEHNDQNLEEGVGEGEGARIRKVIVAVEGLEWSCINFTKIQKRLLNRERKVTCLGLGHGSARHDTSRSRPNSIPTLTL